MRKEKPLRPLSEKKLETCKLARGFPNTYPEKDVAEAVRRLKEGIHVFNESVLGDKGRNNLINEIFGDLE